MDMVVNRLSQIETESVKIIEEANGQKKELDQALDVELKKYDAKVDADTEQELRRLQEQLRDEMEKSLAELRAETQHLAKNMEEDYKIHHKTLAAEIVKKLVEG